ncbi:MAG: hypothetical protein AAF224_06840 [Pseudomonadota bacterium]
MLEALFRFAIAVFAILMILAGSVLLLSPIPFGIILITLGFLLLVTAAPSAVRWVRKHWKWFDRRMDNLERRLPEFIAKRLRASDYDHGEDNETD